MLLNKKTKTYSDVLYKWLSSKKNHIKESTYSRYLIIIESYIMNYLGNIYFKKLTTDDIKNFFNQDDISILSNSLKSNIYIIINSSIKFGIEMKYCKIKTIDKMVFKKNVNNVTFFTKKEEELLVEYLKNNMNLKNLLVLLGLFSGMRIGELCALKWSDIDFVNSTISVNRTVQRVKNIDNNSNSNSKTKLLIDKPKTESSIRKIPLPEIMMNFLNEYRKEEDCYIFTNDLERPKDPRAVEKYFAGLLNKIGINSLNFHSLRHTYATRLREDNVDIKIISELLGHSDWKITQSIYIHTTMEKKRSSIETFNCYLLESS